MYEIRYDVATQTASLYLLDRHSRITVSYLPTLLSLHGISILPIEITADSRQDSADNGAVEGTQEYAHP